MRNPERRGVGGAADAAAGLDHARTAVLFRQAGARTPHRPRKSNPPVCERATNRPSTASDKWVSTLVAGTRILLPTLLLVAVASVLVLVVLPAVLAAAGRTTP
jgi:hypothetical protein